MKEFVIKAGKDTTLDKERIKLLLGRISDSCDNVGVLLKHAGDLTPAVQAVVAHVLALESLTEDYTPDLRYDNLQHCRFVADVLELGLTPFHLEHEKMGYDGPAVLVEDLDHIAGRTVPIVWDKVGSQYRVRPHC